MLRSISLFVAAGVCEIAGGYLVGVFVLLSILWGWGVDRVAPDAFDLLGGALCLAGVAVIMYWPR